MKIRWWCQTGVKNWVMNDELWVMSDEKTLTKQPLTFQKKISFFSFFFSFLAQFSLLSFLLGQDRKNISYKSHIKWNRTFSYTLNSKKSFHANVQTVQLCRQLDIPEFWIHLGLPSTMTTTLFTNIYIYIYIWKQRLPQLCAIDP